MSDEIKPCQDCPHCGVHLSSRIYANVLDSYEHPYNGCINSSRTIYADQLDAWNRRATVSKEVVEELTNYLHHSEHCKGFRSKGVCGCGLLRAIARYEAEVMGGK